MNSEESMAQCTSAKFKPVAIADGIILPLGRIRDILDSDRHIVYEVVRITGGRPVFLRDHYERFVNSLSLIGKTPVLTEADFMSGIRTAADVCGITDNNLRIEQYRLRGCPDEHVIIYPIHSVYPTQEMFTDGIRAGILKGERSNPQAKIFNKAIRDDSDRMIREEGVTEVLLINRGGEITEGSRSNVFFIEGDTVFSPPQSAALPGITRMKVLEIMNEQGIRYREEHIPLSSVGSFDSAFLTGTSKDVLPIALITGQSCDEARFDVHDHTLRRLMDCYRIRVSQDE